MADQAIESNEEIQISGRKQSAFLTQHQREQYILPAARFAQGIGRAGLGIAAPISLFPAIIAGKHRMEGRQFSRTASAEQAG